MYVGIYTSPYRKLKFVTTHLDSLLRMAHEDRTCSEKTWSIKFDPNEKTAQTLRLS